MRVLMLTVNLDRPEAHLMLGLVNAGVQITLVMDRRSPFQEILEGSSIEIIYHSFKSRLDPASILFIRKLINKRNYDLVHTFSTRALTSALLATVMKKIRHVTYRGTTGHLSKLDPSSWLGYLNPKVDKIICVSEAVKNYMRHQGLPESKLVRIYKGHKPEWYAVNTRLSRAELGVGEETFLISLSANMRPVKGADLLIRAFDFIAPELDIKAVLVGDVRDPDISKLLKPDHKSGRIIMAGFRKDAAEIVSLSDAFCMPSRKREGLPKALIEAMIQAKPSVVTNVGGMPELVKDGQHGYVVEEESPHAIAQAIIKLYNDRQLCHKFGQAAKERILSNFTVENTVQETLRVYST